MTLEERVAALEQAKAEDAKKIEALHEAVVMLLAAVVEEPPKEDRLAVMGARFRERAGRST